MKRGAQTPNINQQNNPRYAVVHPQVQQFREENINVQEYQQFSPHASGLLQSAGHVNQFVNPPHVTFPPQGLPPQFDPRMYSPAAIPSASIIAPSPGSFLPIPQPQPMLYQASPVPGPFAPLLVQNIRPAFQMPPPASPQTPSPRNVVPPTTGVLSFPQQLVPPIIHQNLIYRSTPTFHTFTVPNSQASTNSVTRTTPSQTVQWTPIAPNTQYHQAPSPQVSTHHLETPQSTPVHSSRNVTPVVPPSAPEAVTTPVSVLPQASPAISLPVPSNSFLPMDAFGLQFQPLPPPPQGLRQMHPQAPMMIPIANGSHIMNGTPVPVLYLRTPYPAAMPAVGIRPPTVMGSAEKREKKIIRIQDPESERDITDEVLRRDKDKSLAAKEFESQVALIAGKTPKKEVIFQPEAEESDHETQDEEQSEAASTDSKEHNQEIEQPASSEFLDDNATESKSDAEESQILTCIVSAIKVEYEIGDGGVDKTETAQEQESKEVDKEVNKESSTEKFPKSDFGGTVTQLPSEKSPSHFRECQKCKGTCHCKHTSRRVLRRGRHWTGKQCHYGNRDDSKENNTLSSQGSSEGVRVSLSKISSSSLILSDIKVSLSRSSHDGLDESIAKGEEKVLLSGELSENSIALSQITYRPDQWSPSNPDGKKCYDRTQLLLIKQCPICRKRPLALSNCEIVTKDSDCRAPKAKFPDFTPTYLKSNVPCVIPCWTPPKTNLQREQSQKVKVIELQSLGKDVQLHESANAWKPNRMAKPSVPTSADLQAKSDELAKKVRAILNKLTPQKFDTLLEQVNNLEIETEENLSMVIDLVFEKAIDEPSFSVAYAKMCKKVGSKQVPKAGMKDTNVNFRKLLINRCQKEFERETNEVANAAWNEKLEAAETEEVRKELEEEKGDEERKARRRTLGNVRFIGELFKLQMLTANIMHECVSKLLNAEEDDSLECLCRLLTTIGSQLEGLGSGNGKEGTYRMDNYFKRIQDIVSKHQTSSRVRFMLQDVMELRSSRWKPRREDANPKTIDELHKDIEKEKLQEQIRLQEDSSRKRNNNGDRNNKRSQNSALQHPNSNTGVVDSGWSTVSKRNTINPGKLKLPKQTDDNIQLGPKAVSQMWVKGSSGGGKVGQETERNNRFSALSAAEGSPFDSSSIALMPISPSSMDSRSRSPAFTPRSPLLNAQREKEEVLEVVKKFSRTGELSPVRKNSVTKKPPAVATLTETIENTPVVEQAAEPAPKTTTSTDEIKRKIEELIDEFVSNQELSDAVQNVLELDDDSEIPMFVEVTINHMLDSSSTHRLLVGQLFEDLINKNALNFTHCIQGFHKIFDVAEDLEVDIPKFWEYIGEVVTPLLQNGELQRLEVLLEPLRSNPDTVRLAKKFFVSSIRGLTLCSPKEEIAESWENFKLSAFLGVEEDPQQFFKDNGLDFLASSENPNDLAFLLSGRNAPNDEIAEWIEENIEEFDKKFIADLLQALIENSTPKDSGEFSKDKFQYRSELLRLVVSKGENAVRDKETAVFLAFQNLLEVTRLHDSIVTECISALKDAKVLSAESFNLLKSSTTTDDGGTLDVVLTLASEVFKNENE